MPTPDPTRPMSEDALATYLATLIDDPLGGKRLVGEGAAPWPEPGHPVAFVVSGRNPMDTRLDDFLNERRHTLLRDRLVAVQSIARCVEVDAYAPDGSWREPSFWVSGPEAARLEAELLPLAHAFRQRAIFRVTDAEIAVLMTDRAHDGVVAGARRRDHTSQGDGETG
jgi:hypothetical protein